MFDLIISFHISIFFHIFPEDYLNLLYCGQKVCPPLFLPVLEAGDSINFFNTAFIAATEDEVWALVA